MRLPMTTLLATLPTPLRERARWISPASTASTRAPAGIVVWPRMALRASDNPLIDVGVALANAMSVPVFVYQGLSDKTPWATARVHTFILEGASEFHQGLHDRGLRSVLHVERDGHRAPLLRDWLDAGWWVVVDDVPVPPLSQWVQSLSARGTVIAVDAACTVPMQLSRSQPTRAFSFRQQHASHFSARVQHTFDAVRPLHTDTAPLSITPVDPTSLNDDTIAALVASTNVDHGVGAVNSRGGARAGSARADDFFARKIHSYAYDRNDPLRDGVSRLSPWLHFGFVSPWALARRAVDMKGDGPEKFIDELFVWRELSWHWAFHERGDLHSLSVLPKFARDVLRTHAPDVGRLHITDDTLAHAQTGDALWDAAQESLRLLGHLHNNVRMTWGKAIVKWSSADDALRRLIDLNHRYALDGRDPSSYGGLYWCLGLFDRPFPHADGSDGLRERSSVDHARRLDVKRWLTSLRAQAAQPKS
jgi:deoxyribodipyrimidine photolyase